LPINTSSSSLTPFAGLTPEVLLKAVDRLGFVSDGRFLALNSYENRVYQIHLEDAAPLIVKFYRPQRWSVQALLEEHAFSLAAARLDLPVVPPIEVAGRSLFEYAGFHYALFKRQGGQWPELNTRDDRILMGRVLGRLHSLGELATFVHRPSFNAGTLVDESQATILNSDQLPAHQVTRYQDTIDEIFEIIETCQHSTGSMRSLRIHGDCHRGNVLWTAQGPHFVDLDDAQNGPAVQDLWMLLAGSRDEMRAQWADLLEGYAQFRVFPAHEWAFIPAARLARMVHYAAWLLRRFNDPAFPRAFPWFATARYWDEHIQSLQDEIQQFRVDSVV
jgi:Ser/Thr protein kinase RdoA (MazF antagonist)